MMLYLSLDAKPFGSQSARTIIGSNHLVRDRLIIEGGKRQKPYRGHIDSCDWSVTLFGGGDSKRNPEL